MNKKQKNKKAKTTNYFSGEIREELMCSFPFIIENSKSFIKAYKKFKNTRLSRKKYAKAQDVIPVVEFLISKKSHMLSGTDVVADFSESNSFRI